MFSLALAFFLFGAGATSQPVIQNPGFEASPPLAGWQVSTRVRQEGGRAPTLAVDESDAKEGRQSLRLEAQDPAYASASQRIFLPVGSLWRARVWVKSENLGSAGSGSAGAMLSIESPAGDLAASPGRSGTTPWQEEEVTFRVPSPGFIDLNLVGMLRGTGRVWFDDVRMEAVSTEAREDVHIFAEHTTQRPIDAKQQGQFIELLCNLIPSIVAQQVVSTSFEDAPPCHVAYKREVDAPYRPWYPDGAVQVAQYSFDTDNPFSGVRSQKIVLPVAHARAGISQDGFYVKPGITYKLRLHMRGEGNPRVWASLHGGGQVIAGPTLLGRAGEKWAAAEVEFRPNGATDNSTLTIDFEGPGSIWLDRVYVIGSDAVLGIWRPDVVRVLKAMHPGIIRFGGSTTEAYEWDRAIGPWDDRPGFSTVWGGWEENFVGIDEFIRLCELVGAEPLICVRWTGKQPEDAAAEVEYANGDIQTPWGAKRARNGHPAPYHVKYWQIGNEVDATNYPNSVRAFAEAMKKADPSIKLMSSYPTKRLLEAAGTAFDFLSPHHYEVADLAGEEHNFLELRDWIVNHANGKDIRIGVTEWNTTGGQFGLTRGMLQTLGNGLSVARYLNLLQRYADLVEIGNRSNFSDSFGSGCVVTGPGWIYQAPAYYAHEMYARAAGSFPIRVERTSGLPWHLQEPDLSASVSADGKKLWIYAVNSTLDPLVRNFDLQSFRAEIAGGTVYTLEDRDDAGTSEVMNSRDDPQRISLQSRPAGLHGTKFDFSFSPLTVTLLELSLSK
jgi:alpha-N-arabinofuranosidase